MRFAIDSNILVYAEGWGDSARCKAAHDLIEQLDLNDGVLPAQALGELYNVLTKKAGRSAPDAHQALLMWSDSMAVADTTHSALIAACDLAGAHGLQFWDALIFSAAAQARCRVLLTENLREGFTWQGMTVVNPFAKKSHALLKQLLA